MLFESKWKSCCLKGPVNSNSEEGLNTLGVSTVIYPRKSLITVESFRVLREKRYQGDGGGEYDGLTPLSSVRSRYDRLSFNDTRCVY